MKNLDFNRNRLFLVLLMMLLASLCEINTMYADVIAKKVFKYSYDNAGNRIKREYIYASPCPGNPNCRTKPNDTMKQKTLDSLFVIAQNIEIKLPETPTEKPTYDGMPELKNVYPNPTKGLFVLEFTSLILNGSLQILDTKGNVLDELRLDGTQWEIDLSLFSAGEYILFIRTTDGKVYNKKIVKI